MTEPAATTLPDAVRRLDMRAHASAAGLVQLCLELRAAGVIDEAAVGRIKDVIATGLADYAPRSTTKREFLSNVRARLDSVFGGHEPVGRMPPDFEDQDPS